MKSGDKKKLVSTVLIELEKLLHRAIDENRTGDLNVFEMIMVSADTLSRTYNTKKKIKAEKQEAQLATVIPFKRK